MKWTWKLIFCAFGRHAKAKGDWQKACSGTKLIRICPRCAAITEEKSIRIEQHIADTLKKKVDKDIEDAYLGRRVRPHRSGGGKYVGEIFSNK